MVNTYSLHNHIVNCSLPRYYGTKWHDDIRKSRFGAVSWQVITGSNVDPLLWCCIFRQQAISWTRVWHIKKFHLLDFQDFTFFNTDYLWFRRKCSPNSCHDVTVEPLLKGQESLTKVAKFGPYSHTILYKSYLFYPSWQATSFERPPSWKAFIEGFHCIVTCLT